MLPFFQWCENTVLGQLIRDSLWLFPVIESVHLLALALIGGAVLIVDLRLLGWAFRSQSTAHVAREAQPWLTGALSAMIVSGMLLFSSEAVKCYYSYAFWTKMAALGPAIIFALMIRPKVTSGAAGIRPLWSKLTALVSLSLWLTVGAAGRWIGFSG
jgi:hypothetical protein